MSKLSRYTIFSQDMKFSELFFFLLFSLLIIPKTNSPEDLAVEEMLQLKNTAKSLSSLVL